MNTRDDEDEELEKTSVVPSDTFKIRLARAEKAPPCLVFLSGPKNLIGAPQPLEAEEYVLGRSRASDICVEDKTVSKLHAKLSLSDGEISVVDLGSTNKTRVNKVSLEPDVPRVLKNNDRVEIGNVLFKFLESGNIETLSTAETFEKSFIDSLTSVANRGGFDRRAERLIGSFSIVTFDVDFFKKINDQWGHDAGDYVLIELAKIVRDKVIRQGDFFARTGGEEFTILLMNNSSEKAGDVAERLRQTIEAHEFRFEDKILNITVSVGVACRKHEEEDWRVVFKRADQALYSSKRAGRNSVTVDSEDEPL